MVGYALGFEMINFLDMWFPDEIHAVIWFFKCKKKKKNSPAEIQHQHVKEFDD